MDSQSGRNDRASEEVKTEAKETQPQAIDCLGGSTVLSPCMIFGDNNPLDIPLNI